MSEAISQPLYVPPMYVHVALHLQPPDVYMLVFVVGNKHTRSDVVDGAFV